MKEAASAKLKSLYIVRFLLEMAGILLVIFAVFGTILECITPRGFHGDQSIARPIFTVAMMYLCGIGLLLPQMLAKLVSSLLLVGAGVWIFCIDAYRSANLMIYSLFLVPILLTLWLRKGLGDLALRRLPNAN
jgi:hypothetical protein